MNIIKDISSIVGCASAIIALCVVISKPIRKWLKEKVRVKTTQSDLDEIKALLEQHVHADEEFRANVLESIDALNDGNAMIMGTTIKNIYNKYKASQEIPEHEYRIVEKMFHVYHDLLHCNGVIQHIWDEIQTWDVVVDC